MGSVGFVEIKMLRTTIWWAVQVVLISTVNPVWLRPIRANLACIVTEQKSKKEKIKKLKMKKSNLPGSRVDLGFVGLAHLFCSPHGSTGKAY